jgi:hypothetical protein
MDDFLSLESLGSPIQAPYKDKPSAVKLKHLCPEDKARIGELVRRLAVEKKERAKLDREILALKKELSASDKDRSRLATELNLARQQLTDTQSALQRGILNAEARAADLCKTSCNEEAASMGRGGVLSSFKFSSPQSTYRTSLTSSSEKRSCSVQTVSEKQVQTEALSELTSPTPKHKPKRAIDEMKDLHKDIASLTQSVKGMALQSSVRTSQEMLPRSLLSPEMSKQRPAKQNLFLTSLKDPMFLESLSNYQRSNLHTSTPNLEEGRPTLQTDDLSSPRHNPLVTPRTVEASSLRIPDDKSTYFSDSLFRLVDELEAQPTARWPERSVSSQYSHPNKLQ